MLHLRPVKTIFTNRKGTEEEDCVKKTWNDWKTFFSKLDFAVIMKF